MANLNIGSHTIVSDDSGTPSLSASLNFPAGHILQIQSTKYGTRYYHNTHNATDLFSVSITPKLGNSKMMIQIHLCHGSQDDSGFALDRNGTRIHQHGYTHSYSDPTTFVSSDQFYLQDVYSINTLSFMFEDTPNTTSVVTYKIISDAKGGNTGTLYLNRDTNDSGAGSSSITVMEVAQ